jgi:hypothetical protein
MAKNWKEYLHRTRSDPGKIPRGVEDEKTDHPTQTSNLLKSPTQSMLPLSSDVVCLVYHSGRYICVYTSCDEKHTEIMRCFWHGIGQSYWLDPSRKPLHLLELHAFKTSSTSPCSATLPNLILFAYIEVEMRARYAVSIPVIMSSRRLSCLRYGHRLL